MKLLKALTSSKGNIVYVNYSPSERIDDKGNKLICVESGCKGWHFEPVEFSQRWYNSTCGFQITIKMEVDNTMGFVTDYINLTDVKPDFVKFPHSDIY